MEYVLETAALCKRYGKFEALRSLTMSVPRGAIYGLIGKNGAGKSTLLRLICGLQAPTDGSYRLYGTDAHDRAIGKARAHMGAVVETPALYLDMSAVENLREQALALGLPDGGDIFALLSLVGLGNVGKKRVRHFSLGMRQRLGIAVALLGNPDFLILDEPLNGLDPQGILEMRELILTLNRERGITVLVSSHILDELSKIATHFGFIHEGRMVREADAETLRKSFRKYTALRVDDVRACAVALDKLGLSYEVAGENEVLLFSDITLTRLVEALSAQSCELLTATRRDESLETYFLDLVGGNG